VQVRRRQTPMSAFLRRVAMARLRRPCEQGAMRAMSQEVPSDHYDLRAVGAEQPMPFEVNGEPTDITKVLANGQKQIGYSSRYARNWDRIFQKEQSGLPRELTATDTATDATRSTSPSE